MAQNSINQNGRGIFGLPVLSGVKFAKTYSVNSGTGDIDIYTVPAGKRTILMAGITDKWAAGNVTEQFQIKISGTYNHVNKANTTTPPSQAQGFYFPILEAGESFSVNTSASGINIWFNGIEFDADASIKGARILNLANGDNTLYTCPAGKNAVISRYSVLFMVNNSGIASYNESGANRILYFNAVPSGGSPSAANKFIKDFTVTNAASVSFSNETICLNPGDYINCNTDGGTAGQRVWTYIMEY